MSDSSRTQPKGAEADSRSAELEKLILEQEEEMQQGQFQRPQSHTVSLDHQSEPAWALTDESTDPAVIATGADLRAEQEQSDLTLHAFVSGVLRGFPDSWQDTWHLVNGERMSIREAARSQGKDESTLRYRLARMRTEMQKQLLERL